MKIIGKSIVAEVHKQARVSERLRMNYNIHESLDEDIHKLLNSLQPETIMPIHRHLHPSKKETFVLLQGAIEVLRYDDNKTIVERHLMSSESGNIICEIMPGEWHSLRVLESDTLILEIKKGPYIPFQDIDLLK
ncbi:WbuC family cupin fold metalloprotein [Bacteroides faecium]|uniref:Cupin fold metalloprotein, WbuC family n=1 Tax=Bacteroides faecium TaxID=2715212 RepID=A0A6H0KSS2_9BACE|nr:WbuC family cupin fold metalloprotein [Bacteroides faecium]QIU96345.1 cupin fold metalloprotein, WbuC family [Bacteroides faecium]